MPVHPIQHDGGQAGGAALVAHGALGSTMQGDCPVFPGPLFAAPLINHFLESYDKSIVALFTIILALSTIGLWTTTDRLYRAGENQLDLASKSLLATQSFAQASDRSAQASERSAKVAEMSLAAVEAPLLRAQLMEQGICRQAGKPEYHFGVIQYAFANHGRTSARIMQLVHKVHFSKDNAFPDPIQTMSDGHLVPTPYGTVCPPYGQSDRFDCQTATAVLTSPTSDEVGELIEYDAFFLGSLIYQTASGETYRMGFCFGYDKYKQEWQLRGEEAYNYCRREDLNGGGLTLPNMPSAQAEELIVITGGHVAALLLSALQVALTLAGAAAMATLA